MLTFRADTVGVCNLIYPESLQIDSLWFEDAASYASSFNDLIYMLIHLVDSVPSNIIHDTTQIDESELQALVEKYPDMGHSGEIKIVNKTDTMASHIIDIPMNFIERTDSLEYSLSRVIQLDGDSLKLKLEYISMDSALALSELIFDRSLENLSESINDSLISLPTVHNRSLRILRQHEMNELNTYYYCQSRQMQSKGENEIARLWTRVKSLVKRNNPFSASGPE